MPPNDDIPGPDLTREQQIELLKSGVDKWNAWREANPGCRPPLSNTAPLMDAITEMSRCERNLEETGPMNALPPDDALLVNFASENLEGADLHDADLSGLSFEGANLKEANLRKAYLAQANLDGATLVGADLEEACLEDASLQQALLARASLTRANLKNADLKGAGLQRAILREATLYQARLTSTQLRHANLTGTDLQEADLRNAYLIRASLVEARLNGAALEEADLTEADLTEADLRDANLVCARLVRCDLTDAIVEGAWVQDVHVQDLRGLPKPPAMLRLGEPGQDKRPLTGHEAERFFHCPAIVEVFFAERLDNDTMAGFHFHLAEMQKKNVGTDVFLVGHRQEGAGSVLQFQAPDYEAIYAVLPDLLAPFQQSRAIDWRRSLEALTEKERPDAINALVRAETTTPERAWHFAERLAGFFPQFIKAEITEIRTANNQGQSGRAMRLELRTDEELLKRLDAPTTINALRIDRIGNETNFLEVTAMNDRSMKAGGDIVNAVTGDHSSATAHDITIIKRNVDKAAIPEDDLKEALKTALIELDDLDIPDDDKADAARDLDRLKTELEKPTRDPSRVKLFFERVKALASPVASAIEAAKSWGKIFEGMTD